MTRITIMATICGRQYEARSYHKKLVNHPGENVLVIPRRANAPPYWLHQVDGHIKCMRYVSRMAADIILRAWRLNERAKGTVSAG